MTLDRGKTLTRGEKRLNSSLLGLVVVVASTRGVLELFLGRMAAYAAQVLLIAVLLLVVDYRIRSVNGFRSLLSLNHTFIEFSVVIGFAVVSALVTQTERGMVGLQYFLVLVFTWYLIMFLSRQSRPGVLDFNWLYWGVSLSACMLGVVGMLQQMGIFSIEMEGYTQLNDIIRPPSLTASYLHYPLITGIAAANSYIALRKRVKYAVYPFVFLTVTTFASFSRSGMLVITATILIALAGGRRTHVRAALGGFVLLGIGAISLYLSTDNSVLTLIVERMLSSFDTESLGNDTRTHIWNDAFGLMDPKNFLVGNYFGLVTNSADESIRSLYGIVESSLLQQILNIGLIGSIVYYHTFYRFIKRIPKNYRDAKYVIWAAVIQSLFYQSIEVIPFLVMVAVTFLISYSYQADYKNEQV